MLSKQDIVSVQNSRIKTVVKLRQRKYREETNTMIVEGAREVLAACRSGVTLKEVYFSKNWWGQDIDVQVKDMIQKKAEHYWILMDKLFEKISFGQRRSDVLAVCDQPKTTLDELVVKDCSLVVVIEQIEKPGNLGAILRSCDGVGADALIVCDPATDMYNPNVVRSSLGTIFSVPVIAATNEQTLAFLKRQGVHVCATIVQSDVHYTQADLTKPTALVLGSEKQGLSAFWQQHADLKVKIPMKGMADSLNVSATAAIMLYEALRQRQ